MKKRAPIDIPAGALPRVSEKARRPNRVMRIVTAPLRISIWVIVHLITLNAQASLPYAPARHAAVLHQ